MTIKGTNKKNTIMAGHKAPSVCALPTKRLHGGQTSPKEQGLHPNNKSRQANNEDDTTGGAVIGTIRIAQSVIDKIMATIGSRPPESGGILLGPIREDSITRFVFDDQGKTSPTTYSPSAASLQSLCEKAERELGLELKGCAHSHPGLSTPSPGDLYYVQRFFEANPSMPRFIMPILPRTPIVNSPSDRSDAINFWVIERSNPTDYRSADVEIASEGARSESGLFGRLDVTKIRQMLGVETVRIDSLDCGETEVTCMIVKIDDVEMMVLLPSEFPVMPPAVVVSGPLSHSTQAMFHWLIESKRTGEERLVRLLQKIHGEETKVF